MLLDIYWAFIKIGAIAYGGGYAMIPLLQREIVDRGWLSTREFLDIVAISQMTPGPVAVNSATFVGYRLAGVMGSLVATVAVITPSIIFLWFLFRMLRRFGSIETLQHAKGGIHCIVVALITAAGLYLIPTSIVDVKTLVIALATFFLMIRTKANPIVLIALGAIVGLI